METTTSIDIERPAAEVFDYVADMSNNPNWQRGQVICTWTSQPPIGVGSTYDQEAKFVGTTLTSSFEVTEFEPGRLIRIMTTSGNMPIDVTRVVEPVAPQSCRVTATVRGQPPLVMRLLGPLLRAMLRNSVRRDYVTLKSLLESETD